MKPRFKKSKETIVRQWLSKNRNLLKINDSAFISDMETIESNKRLFVFKWNGVNGSILCNKRVMPSSLIID